METGIGDVALPLYHRRRVTDILGQQGQADPHRNAHQENAHHLHRTTPRNRRHIWGSSILVAGGGSCAIHEASMIDHPSPDDHKPTEVAASLPPTALKLVARQLREAAVAAQMRGDLAQAAKLRARADVLCPPAPPAG